MVEIKVINDRNDALDLSSDSRYTVYKVDGLTPSKASVSSTNMSAKNGTSFNRVNVEGRNIVIYLKINGDISANRIALYQWFLTGNFARIEVKSEAREAFIEGYVESFECDLFSNNQTAQISIACEDPYFRSIQEYLLRDPQKNGSKYIFNINYHGDVDTGFVYGKETGGYFNSFTIKLRDEFIGVTVPYWIDSGSFAMSTEIGNVYANNYLNEELMANMLDYLKDGSTFLQLKNGMNNIVVETDNGSSIWRPYILYREKYGGI